MWATQKMPQVIYTELFELSLPLLMPPPSSSSIKRETEQLQIVLLSFVCRTIEKWFFFFLHFYDYSFSRPVTLLNILCSRWKIDENKYHANTLYICVCVLGILWFFEKLSYTIHGIGFCVTSRPSI